MNKLVENKKAIIPFLLWMFVMGSVWIISSLLISKWSLSFWWTPNYPTSISSPIISGSVVSGAFVAASGAAKPMNWDSAMTFIQNAPVEKIQVAGLSIKLFITWGDSFVTQQPTKDAYKAIVNTTKTKVELVAKF